MRIFRRDQSGFTMVETMAALGVFLVVSLGLAPLLLVSVRGTTSTRADTVAKNFASEAMERVRGFPFFESVKGGASPTRQDVIDLYFPDRVVGPSGSGFNATTNTYTTICSKTATTTVRLPAASGAQACPTNIPIGYSAQFTARFVKPGAVPAAGQSQAFITAAPVVGYAWNVTATELPPAQLLEMTLKVTWEASSKPHTYQFATLIGPRRASAETIRGAADLEAVIQARTGYVDALNRTSTLTLTGGRTSSRVNVRGVGAADHTSFAGEMLLQRDGYTVEGSVQAAETLFDLFGASVSQHSPPNSGPNTAAGGTVTGNHPDVTVPGATVSNVIAGITTSAQNAVTTQILDELPLATGTMDTTGALGATTFWLQNQVAQTPTSYLRLDSTRPILKATRVTSSVSGHTGRLSGRSSAQALAMTAVGGGRVETKAHGELGKVELFPLAWPQVTGEKALIVIENFQADINCTGTSAPLATGSASGTWSATIRIWADKTANGNPSGGAGYVSFPVSGSTTGVGSGVVWESSYGSNPLVYDNGQNDPSSIYLFNTPTQLGYLESMTTSTGISSRLTGARRSSVNLPAAIQINTARTNPAIPSSTLNVDIGKLSCEAVDSR